MADRAKWMIGCLLLGLLVGAVPATAQATAGAVYDVFLGIERDRPTLFFVDARTGLSAVVPAEGTRHTLLAQGVLFEEKDTGIIRIAYPDGRVERFEAIQPPGPNLVVDWVVSPNRRRIAWAVTQGQGLQVFSDLYVAESDGRAVLLVLHTSSTQGVGRLPLALSNDGAMLFYTQRTNMFEPRPAFLTVDNVFQLDIARGEPLALFEEARCPCAVAFSPEGRLFALLEESGEGGFDVRLRDLSVNVETLIGAAQKDQDQGGLPLLSPNGALIVYTTARAASRTQSNYALVLADTGRREQRVLATGIRSAVRALAFTPDNQAVLVVGMERSVTYKLSLESGELLQVSDDVYLGQLPPGS